MWQDEIIRREEEEQEMLRQIIDLTQSGAIRWECISYNPVSLMNGNDYDNSPAYLSQMFTLKTKVEGLPYSFEAMETIDLPDGKGDISITLRREVADDFMEINRSLTMDDRYEDCSAAELLEHYRSDPIVTLCDLVVPQVIGSSPVDEVYTYARFINETGISRNTLKHPMTKLAESLFNEHRIQDFHRCVLDTSYRAELMGE